MSKKIQVTNVQLGEIIRHLAGGLLLLAEIISPEDSKSIAKKKG